MNEANRNLIDVDFVQRRAAVAASDVSATCLQSDLPENVVHQITQIVASEPALNPLVLQEHYVDFTPGLLEVRRALATYFRVLFLGKRSCITGLCAAFDERGELAPE